MLAAPSIKQCEGVILHNVVVIGVDSRIGVEVCVEVSIEVCVEVCVGIQARTALFNASLAEADNLSGIIIVMGPTPDVLVPPVEQSAGGLRLSDASESSTTGSGEFRSADIDSRDIRRVDVLKWPPGGLSMSEISSMSRSFPQALSDVRIGLIRVFTRDFTTILLC